MLLNFHGKTKGDLENKYKTGVLMIGYKTLHGEYMINPALDDHLILGSKLFVLGSPIQIKELNNLFGVEMI